MIKNAVRTVRTLLPSTGSITLEQIEKAVEDILIIPQYSNLNKELIIREIQSIYNVRVDDFSIIEDSERRRPWVADKKSTLPWSFWNRYREYLSDNKNFPDIVINQLDRLTDKTLDGLFNPAINGKIDKKGLVVGQVQSGKTANYTGLICKAADAGFKLVIVLAGIHNNLRSQTQLRLDEGFLGFNTRFAQVFNQIDKDDIWIGVGRISKKEIAHSITSCLDKGDFSQGAFNSLGLNFNTNEPIIAIVKKNGSILARLLRWLTAQSSEINGTRYISNKSLLIIDDEADNASINTRPENDGTTRINGLIRDIIRLFEKSGYVGYTATPFANIFVPIEEDELFPRDFIINIPAPSNYIGPEQVFGFQLVEDNENSDTVLPIVRRINDFHKFVPNRHKNGDRLPNEAPKSLLLSIKCFIITCAIRRLRGQDNVHNSMLVHVSRFVTWQRQIKGIVQNVFDFYRRGIEMNISTVLEEIRQAFEEDTNIYKSYKTTSQMILNSEQSDLDPSIKVHNWQEVQLYLNDAASRIQVMEINGGSADVLNYFNHSEGLSVIAIGGDKLSRGLTLEGLSVSYYLRASRMYDTLMQMGRWFGYRRGYVDLCRLFTSRELNEWFCHIALASEELRDEFDYMSDVAGSTPEDYALRVRTHPGVLQISASNKIRRAENVRVSWSGRLTETYMLSKDPAIINSNLMNTNSFLNCLGDDFINDRNYFLWNNIPFTNIREFLLGFKSLDELKSSSPQNLLKFITYKYNNKELQSWNVGLITKNNGTECIINEKIKVNLIKRTQDEKSDAEIYYIRKSHIISPEDEFIDLTSKEKEVALKNSLQLWKAKGKEGEPKRLSGDWVRNNIRKPDKVLLLIYLLDPEGAKLPQGSKPIVGFAISFPGTERDDAVSYAVHSQLLQNFDIEEIYEPEDEENEED